MKLSLNQVGIRNENSIIMFATRNPSLIWMEKNMKKDINDDIRVTWELRKVNNVYPAWYTEEGGTYCSVCNIAYDFDDSYKALLLCRAKGQVRGPRCIRCGRTLRTRSKTNPKSKFWLIVDMIEGRK